MLGSKPDEHKLKTLSAIAFAMQKTHEINNDLLYIASAQVWVQSLFDAILSGSHDKIIGLFSILTFLNNQHIYDQKWEKYLLLDRLVPYTSLFEDPNSLKFLNLCKIQNVEFINSWITKLETDPTITANSTNTINWLLSHLCVFMNALHNPECITEINQLDDQPYIMKIFIKISS